MPGYRDKLAVVTGGASGIGYAVASRAATQGMTVVLADIDTERLDQAAALLRGRALFRELEEAGSAVHVSVLCPAAVIPTTSRSTPISGTRRAVRRRSQGRC